METIPQDFTPPDKKRPGWLLMTGTIVLVLISMLLWSRIKYLTTGELSSAIGGAAAPLIWAIIVALLFSISVRYRSARAKTKVVMCATILFIGGGIGKMNESWNCAVVRGINANCPKMIDEATRMEGATSGPGNMITIRNTIVSVDRASFDRAEWRTKFAPALRASALNAPFIRKFLSSGTTVSYRYSGRDGVFIDEIKLTPDELKKK